MIARQQVRNLLIVAVRAMIQNIITRISIKVAQVSQNGVTWVKRNKLAIVTGVVFVLCVAFLTSITLNYLFTGDAKVPEKVEQVIPDSSKTEIPTIKKEGGGIGDGDPFTIIFSVSVILFLLFGVLGAFGKGGDAGKIASKNLIRFGFFTLILFLFFGKSMPSVVTTNQEKMATFAKGEWVQSAPKASPAGPVVTHMKAQWQKTAEAKAIPVGVWSEISPVGIGCTIKFAIGSGDKVQYQYYSENWADYVPGTSPNASALRHMVTVPGQTERPYEIICRS